MGMDVDSVHGVMRHGMIVLVQGGRIVDVIDDGGRSVIGKSPIPSLHSQI